MQSLNITLLKPRESTKQQYFLALGNLQELQRRHYFLTARHVLVAFFYLYFEWGLDVYVAAVELLVRFRDLGLGYMIG